MAEKVIVCFLDLKCLESLLELGEKALNVWRPKTGMPSFAAVEPTASQFGPRTTEVLKETLNINATGALKSRYPTQVDAISYRKVEGLMGDGINKSRTSTEKPLRMPWFFVPTGLPTPFRTTPTPNLKRWKLEGTADPAKEREEACQASDVCFMGDKNKASMVTPPRKSIKLKESKRQDTYPNEPSIQSRNASNRPRGDTSKYAGFGNDETEPLGQEEQKLR
ncbi:hypothetical protein HPB47_022411 [Ixodes persulcatus]|uniref:Uncharacterized protein n=1 Tax=Ixodes persulcatus TaxID=34615 RepID=A0AC60QBN3_IXOPE|nr:hypothetical protein HPB47_022411 [Ixodes persulcatus]